MLLQNLQECIEIMQSSSLMEVKDPSRIKSERAGFEKVCYKIGNIVIEISGPYELLQIVVHKIADTVIPN